MLNLRNARSGLRRTRGGRCLFTVSITERRCDDAKMAADGETKPRKGARTCVLISGLREMQPAPRTVLKGAGVEGCRGAMGFGGFP